MPTKNYIFVISVALLFLISGCGKDETNANNDTKPTTAKVSPEISHICPSDSTITGIEYGVIETEDSISLRNLPSLDSPKIPNKKATTASQIFYCNIDSSTRVIEECTKNGWSYVRVIVPQWLSDTHKGWVEEKFLLKTVKNKYDGRIPRYAVSPYTAEQYPKLTSKYTVDQLKKINELRLGAAELAVDSGMCDMVTDSQLSTSSTNKIFNFFVDCEYQGKNKRFIFTENEIFSQKGQDGNAK